MGFFGMFNYNKPGPGVNKDLYEPPMKVFFSVFFRKFWKMVELNFMYFISTLPIWFLLFIPVSLSDGIEIITKYNLQVLIFMYICVIGLPIFNTGFAFVLRNFSRQNHAWIWHDFIEKVKCNFKQSILLFLIDLVITFVAIVNINFYSSYTIDGNIFMLICKTISIMVFILYFIMHYFIYTIMVTFDLKFKYILKNALILTFVKLPRNIGITILLYLIGCLTFGFNPVIGVFLSAFIMSVFCNYIVTFNAVSLVDKYLMPFSDEEEEEAEESCFSDEQTIKDDHFNITK